MKSRRLACVILMGILWGVSAETASAQQNPTYDVKNGPEVRFSQGCDSSSFFVEARESSATPCPAFAIDLEASLSASFQAKYCEWNVPGGSTVPSSCTLGPGGIFTDGSASVTISHVLPLRWGVHDGYDRFLRVHFMHGSSEVVIPNSWSCAAVRLIREAAVAAGSGSCGTSDLELNVGRECPLVPLAEPSSDWHLDTLVYTPAANPPPQQVNVALLDSGIDDVLISTNVDRFIHPSVFDDSTARLAHGSIMASLIAQAAPYAKIYSLRIFDAGNRATSMSLARAVELAAFELPTPLILNLSVGWAPEHSATHNIRGYSSAALTAGFRFAVSPDLCSTDENGIGESVKFALRLARQMDIFAVAAAGNRPSPSTNAAIAALTDLWSSNVAMQMPGRMFYPAQWSVEPSTHDAYTHLPEVRFLTIAAGAIDARLRRSNVNRNVSGGPVFAPGENVFVQPPANWVPGSNFTISGTSVSTALITAAAARARGNYSLAWAQLAGLMYWGTFPATGGNAISVCEVDQLAQCASVATVSDTDPPWILPQPAFCPIPACVDPSALPLDLQLSPKPNWAPSVSTAPATPCNGATNCYDIWATGPLGPQPINVGCPDCNFKALLDPYVLKDVRLSGKIYPFESGTVINSPYIEVVVAGAVVAHRAVSYTFTPAGAFDFRVPNISIGSVSPDEAIQANLVLRIYRPGAIDGVWDTSPLWTEVR